MFGVGRQRETGTQAPAPPRPDLREKAAHVGGHCPGRASRQDVLEMLARQVVLPLEEERPGQLQADAHQIGPVKQHSAQRGDGLVQQRLPLIVGKIGLLRCSGLPPGR